MADLCGAYHPVRDVCRRDGYLSQRYNDPNLQNEFNVAGFMLNPPETLNQA